MSPTTIRFLKVGMAYFLLGALLGTLLALPVTRDLLFKAPGAQWRLAHSHLNLAGFVIMVIFGVAYHILPRFAGKPLHSEAWASAHFWLATFATAGQRIECRRSGSGGSARALRRSAGKENPMIGPLERDAY